MLSAEQFTTLKSKLDELARALPQQIEAITGGSKPVSLDEPIGRLSRMDAMQQQKMVAANKRSLELRLQLVRAALAAQTEDEYGDCKSCEEPIAYERLLAKPEAPLCVQCQGELEARRRR